MQELYLYKIFNLILVIGNQTQSLSYRNTPSVPLKGFDVSVN